jgi:hypothetical protein
MNSYAKFVLIKLCLEHLHYTRTERIQMKVNIQYNRKHAFNYFLPWVMYAKKKTGKIY